MLLGKTESGLPFLQLSGDPAKLDQLFVNDYTLIRNRVQIVTSKLARHARSSLFPEVWPPGVFKAAVCLAFFFKQLAYTYTSRTGVIR